MNQYSEYRVNRKGFKSFALSSQHNEPLHDNTNILKKQQNLNNTSLNIESRLADHSQKQIDYRSKTFQLMKKNTQLELVAHQSQTHIDRLAKQIDFLQKHIIQLVEINQKNSNSIVCKKSKTKQSAHDRSSVNTYDTHSLYSIVDHNKSKKQNFLNLLHNERITSIEHYPQYPQQHKTTTETNTQSQTPQQIFSGYYQDSMNQIVEQYKKIIETQHKKTNQMHKKYKNIQQKLKKAKQRLKQKDQLCNKIKQQCNEKQQKIQQYQQELKIQKQQHKNQVTLLKQALEESQAQKQQIYTVNTALENKIQEQLQNKAKLQMIAKQYQEKLQTYDEQLKLQKNQRIKLQNRYQQQISHFQEMEDIVEKKLIEVEYEMNNYKKEKKISEQKINRLELMVAYYRKRYPQQISDESQQDRVPAFGGKQQQIVDQLYYSFGGQSQKSEQQLLNQCPQKCNQIKKVQSQKHQKQHQKIGQQYSEQIRKSLQTIKNQDIAKHNQQLFVQQSHNELEISQNNQTDTKQAQKTFPEDDSKQLQRQCYEQSIKTLLKQNNRLKKMMVKYYKKTNNEQQENDDEQGSRQFQMQMKIMMSSVDI